MTVRVAGIRMSFLLSLAVMAWCAQEDNGIGSQDSHIKDYGLREYRRISCALPRQQPTPWKLTCALPYNCHFQPWIEVESDAGQIISFNSTNPLVLYLTPTETYSTRAGVQSVEATKWVSGEGAVYTIPAGVTVRSVKYRETGYDTDFVGSFRCNDPDFNVLWQKGARTAYVCMRDHFYDCPDRERVGFWGDGTPELAQCFYVFDAKSHALCRDLVRRKLQPKFYPGQHLEFLGDYGLWLYYLHTGDLDSLRAVYDQTKEFLFETYRFGNPRTWFDWGKEVKDTAVTEVCFFYNDLDVLRRMAQITGHESDVPEITRKMEEIRGSFRANFWKGAWYQSSQVTEPDDRANAMAVNVGLADPSQWQSIYDQVLSQKTYSSCFFDRWVFEALCRMGKPEQALLRMHKRYQSMIPCSFTTLWEHYDRWWASRIDAFDAASSLNHGWNPPVLNLSHQIAGIAPIAPGWATFQVLPKEAFLTEIAVIVPSIKGLVDVHISKTSTDYTLQVTAPPQTTAIVGIPKVAFTTLSTITANDRLVWNGVYQDNVAGVSGQGDRAEYVTFQVGPGTWTFRAHGTLTLSRAKQPSVPMSDVPALDKRSWEAIASVPDGTFPFSGKKIPISTAAAQALDGDHWTGWRDVTNTQYPGQWLQIDLQKAESFNRIVLDNTWALWDSPVAYAVTVSDDGKTWSQPIASGAGTLGITTITFPKQHARYVRITQTGTSPTYHWSVYELDLYLDP